MSLQVLYSFDHIATADLLALPRVVSVASGGAIAASSGRDGSPCFTTTDGIGAFSTSMGLVIAINNHADVTFGAWIVIESTPAPGKPLIIFGNPDATISNSSNNQVTIVAEPDGSLKAHRSYPGVANGALLGTSPAGTITFGINASYYIEARVVIGSSGSVVVRVNEAIVINVTNVDTQVNSVPDISFISLGNPQSTDKTRYDDMYIATGENTGDDWIGFKGILKIKGLLATGAGALTQWTPSVPSGVNYQNVDEPTPNPTDYNDATTVGLIDLYEIEDVSFDPLAIQVDLYMKKLDAGPSSVGHVLRTGGANFISSESQTLSPDFKYYRKVYTTVPSGGAWTMASFNAIQAGPIKAV